MFYVFENAGEGVDPGKQTVHRCNKPDVSTVGLRLIHQKI